MRQRKSLLTSGNQNFDISLRQTEKKTNRRSSFIPPNPQRFMPKKKKIEKENTFQDFKDLIHLIGKSCVNGFFTDEQLLSFRDTLKDIMKNGELIISRRNQKIEFEQEKEISEILIKWNQFHESIQKIFDIGDSDRKKIFLQFQLNSLLKKIQLIIESKHLSDDDDDDEAAHKKYFGEIRSTCETIDNLLSASISTPNSLPVEASQNDLQVSGNQANSLSKSKDSSLSSILQKSSSTKSKSKSKDKRKNQNNELNSQKPFPENSEEILTRLKKLYHSIQTEFSEFFKLLIPEPTTMQKTIDDCCELIKEAERACTIDQLIQYDMPIINTLRIADIKINQIFQLAPNEANEELNVKPKIKNRKKEEEPLKNSNLIFEELYQESLITEPLTKSEIHEVPYEVYLNNTNLGQTFNGHQHVLDLIENLLPEESSKNGTNEKNSKQAKNKGKTILNNSHYSSKSKRSIINSNTRSNKNSSINHKTNNTTSLNSNSNIRSSTFNNKSDDDINYLSSSSNDANQNSNKKSSRYSRYSGVKIITNDDINSNSPTAQTLNYKINRKFKASRSSNQFRTTSPVSHSTNKHRSSLTNVSMYATNKMRAEVTRRSLLLSKKNELQMEVLEINKRNKNEIEALKKEIEKLTEENIRLNKYSSDIGPTIDPQYKNQLQQEYKEVNFDYLSNIVEIRQNTFRSYEDEIDNLKNINNELFSEYERKYPEKFFRNINTNFKINKNDDDEYYYSESESTSYSASVGSHDGNLTNSSVDHPNRGDINQDQANSQKKEKNQNEEQPQNKEQDKRNNEQSKEEPNEEQKSKEEQNEENQSKEEQNEENQSKEEQNKQNNNNEEQQNEEYNEDQNNQIQDKEQSDEQQNSIEQNDHQNSEGQQKIEQNEDLHEEEENHKENEPNEVNAAENISTDESDEEITYNRDRKPANRSRNVLSPTLSYSSSGDIEVNITSSSANNNAEPIVPKRENKNDRNTIISNEFNSIFNNIRPRSNSTGNLQRSDYQNEGEDANNNYSNDEVSNNYSNNSSNSNRCVDYDYQNLGPEYEQGSQEINDEILSLPQSSSSENVRSDPKTNPSTNENENPSTNESENDRLNSYEKTNSYEINDEKTNSFENEKVNNYDNHHNVSKNTNKVVLESENSFEIGSENVKSFEDYDESPVKFLVFKNGEDKNKENSSLLSENDSEFALNLKRMRNAKKGEFSTSEVGIMNVNLPSLDVSSNPTSSSLEKYNRHRYAFNMTDEGYSSEYYNKKLKRDVREKMERMVKLELEEEEEKIEKEEKKEEKKIKRKRRKTRNKDEGPNKFTKITDLQNYLEEDSKRLKNEITDLKYQNFISNAQKVSTRKEVFDYISLKTKSNKELEVSAEVIRLQNKDLVEKIKEIDGFIQDEEKLIQLFIASQPKTVMNATAEANAALQMRLPLIQQDSKRIADINQRNENISETKSSHKTRSSKIKEKRTLKLYDVSEKAREVFMSLEKARANLSETIEKAKYLLNDLEKDEEACKQKSESFMKTASEDSAFFVRIQIENERIESELKNVEEEALRISRRFGGVPSGKGTRRALLSLKRTTSTLINRNQTRAMEALQNYYDRIQIEEEKQKVIEHVEENKNVPKNEENKVTKDDGNQSSNEQNEETNSNDSKQNINDENEIINDREDENNNVNDDVNGNIKEDINENINDDENENIKDDLNENINDDENENINDAENENIKDDLNENINDDLSENTNDDENIFDAEEQNVNKNVKEEEEFDNEYEEDDNNDDDNENESANSENVDDGNNDDYENYRYSGNDEEENDNN
ncbi:hypothetical protein M9Y10_001558 [Tritrichomonas musculus]|uniref:Uncharacterized protein n=1 Tax=Tritrichomonas musculus TaxID=1915356 RepID=A0ABR2L7Q1_9EUKA